MFEFIKKLFPSKHIKEQKRIMPIVEEINRHYEKLEILSDIELKDKTEEFKKRIGSELEELYSDYSEFREETKHNREDEKVVLEQEKWDKILKKAEQEILDEVLPEAFAVVKETCRRLKEREYTFEVTGHEKTWDMIPYDVQLIGGVILHEGRIAEMATGEGKTLVATMPLYLNALLGKGAHLVTVNDYLARRDGEWMSAVYNFLGLEVGIIQNQMTPEERRVQYSADITYGTNNEFGFDYLRDNMAISKENIVQSRGHNFAIIDEVDSVLIDEARTPLIISGEVDKNMDVFVNMRSRVDDLVRRQKTLTSRLASEAEALLKTNKEEDMEKAAVKLLIVKKGLPKHNKMQKLVQEYNIATLLSDIESRYAINKETHLLDEELFYTIDESSNSVTVSEKGREIIDKYEEDFFILPTLDEELQKIDDDPQMSAKEKGKRREKFIEEYTQKSEKIHAVNQLLKAYSLFEKDVEYIVDQGRVLIVDQFTGRLMPGRRFSDGLHQALEAKEKVKVEKETQTLATITLQNYFRMYRKLAGMTGTAVTEENEFLQIYGMDVVVIPTNRPVIRDDMNDLVFMTKREKYNAAINDIELKNQEGRPVLVGTVSVEVSELLSRMLKRKKINHSVLNAKNHENEAQIVAEAGQKGSVTIATNMAGRGTDIKLGEGVKEVGGLHIIGTERHESRRIDRQLRGRAGRQGDPGSSRFFVSLEDNLMRLFGLDKAARFMDKMGIEEGQAIEHKYITSSIERAQKRVEENNFQIRKNTLEYDDVMNQQRRVIYGFRKDVLYNDDISVEIQDIIQDAIFHIVNSNFGTGYEYESFNFDGLNRNLAEKFYITVDFSKFGEEYSTLNPDNVTDYIYDRFKIFYDDVSKEMESEQVRYIERMAFLQVIDFKWKDHLAEMDRLREGVQFESYAQKKPIIEYKRNGYKLFMEMVTEIKIETSRRIVGYMLAHKERIVIQQQQGRMQHKALDSPNAGRTFTNSPESGGERKPQPIKRDHPKVKPNEPCPCGSGKKYKHCCGK